MLKLKRKVRHTDYYSVILRGVEVGTAEYKQISVPRIKLLLPFVGIKDSYKKCALLCKVKT